MKIYRFSDDGFASQYQSHHYESRDRFINDDDEFAKLIEMCHGNEWQERIMYNQREKERALFSDGRLEEIKYGIWVFTSKKFRRRSLNHLDVIPQMWEAEIADDAIAYDVGLEYRCAISETPAANVFGCFVPQSELGKITNAKKIPNKYQGRPYQDFYRRK